MTFLQSQSQSQKYRLYSNCALLENVTVLDPQGKYEFMVGHNSEILQGQIFFHNSKF